MTLFAVSVRLTGTGWEDRHAASHILLLFCYVGRSFP
jgi:hypothetical protein